MTTTETKQCQLNAMIRSKLGWCYEIHQMTLIKNANNKVDCHLGVHDMHRTNLESLKKVGKIVKEFLPDVEQVFCFGVPIA